MFQQEGSDLMTQWLGNVQGNLIWRIVGALALLLFAHIIIRFVVNRVDHLLERSKMDSTVHLFLVRLTSYSLYALLIVTILSILGVPMTSIIAVLGAATLAIGLALQDSLKNIASSILIIILKPYVVGDFVEINEKTGKVIEVGLYHTRLLTPDNKMLYVPNSEVMSENLTNYSSMEIIRVDMVFGIGYDDNIREARQVLEEILLSDTRILQDPEPTIAVKELGDSSVNFAVQPYAKRDDAVAVGYYVT
ncbi:MAG: mechanosensitive ion channel family protein, partial [Candidatus Promineifilaceae bacterium]